MSFNKKITLSVIIILALIAGSYAVEYIFKANGLKSAAVIKVDYNSTTVALLDSDVLSKLAGSTGNKPGQAGPALLSVLASAGISNYNKVLINGLNTEYEVKISELSNDLIFYFTNHKTVNLGKKGAPHFLVEDVTVINAVQ